MWHEFVGVSVMLCSVIAPSLTLWCVVKISHLRGPGKNNTDDNMPNCVN